MVDPMPMPMCLRTMYSRLLEPTLQMKKSGKRLWRDWKISSESVRENAINFVWRVF